MKRGLVSILLVAIPLALIPRLSTLAGNNTGAINITMTTVETIIEITLDKTDWEIGNVTADTEYKTDPEATWCTINNTGTVKVDIGIKGENAKDALSPTIIWSLSNDGTNGENKYALCYHLSGDTAGNYTPITLNETPIKKSGKNVTIEVSGEKQFGLKLLTPEFFQYYDRNMETHVTISAVPT